MSGPLDQRGRYQGRWTRIRPVAPDDYPWLFHVGVMSDVGNRWRLHGDVPTFDAFVAGLLAGSLATFVIEDLDGAAVGMAQLRQHDAISRTAHLSAFLDPDHEGLGWPLEGVALVLHHGFRAFDLRKVYLESLDDSVATYRSAIGDALRLEGCLVGHRYVLGTYVDCHILALHREDADRLAAELLGDPGP